MEIDIKIFGIRENLPTKIDQIKKPLLLTCGNFDSDSDSESQKQPSNYSDLQNSDTWKLTKEIPSQQKFPHEN